MDYSLLLGIHDCARGEAEGDDMDDGEQDDEDDSDGNVVGGGDRVPSTWGTTPPDSPHQLVRETSLQYEGGIVPELDIYAIPSCDSRFIFSYLLLLCITNKHNYYFYKSNYFK